MLEIDSSNVGIIIDKIVTNAVQYTEKGSVNVRYDYLGDKLIVSVEDTGCGIPKEKQQLAFGLFWKDDGFVPGLGLGLHVSKKLAEGMDLVLDVESQPGFGSKFSLYADAQMKKPTEG